MTDEQGLIGAYALDGKGGGRPLRWEELEPAISGGELVWAHLDRSCEQSIGWLRRSTGLDPIVCDALLAEETRPRAEIIGQGLLVILRGVNLNPGAEPDDMVSLRLWVDERRVISLRHRRVVAIQDLRDKLERGQGPDRAGSLLVQVAGRLIDRMQDSIHAIDETLAEMEERVASGNVANLRVRLSEARRSAIAFRRHIAPQREAMTRLVGAGVAWLTDRDRAQLREDADRLTRYVEELDAARERAVVMHEEIIARATEQMNRAMYVLSLVAGVFLPLGLITGLLGINVGGMPGVDSPTAFVVVCAVLLVIAGFELWLFRRFRWL